MQDTYTFEYLFLVFCLFDPGLSILVGEFESIALANAAAAKGVTASHSCGSIPHIPDIQNKMK